MSYHLLTSSRLFLLFCAAQATAGSAPIEELRSLPRDFCDILPAAWSQKSPENPFIQSMQLGGRFHWQAFHISGNDTNGDSFNDSHDDFRRARIEFRSEFLRYFDLRLNINLVGDNRFRGRDLDWGYENFDEANVTFDIRKSFAIGSLDTLKLRAGSLKHTLGSEAVESSNNLMTIERSAIANKIYGGSRPTGLIVDIGKNDWLLNLGLYSTEAHSDFIGGFNDGFAYYAALNWKATDSWSFRIDGLVNRPDGGTIFSATVGQGLST